MMNEELKSAIDQLAKEAFSDGMETAWECAKKLVWKTGILELRRMGILGENDHEAAKVLAEYTASEAIEKLREYEANKDKIKVGDEVRLKDLGLIGVVTRLADLEQAACIMFDDGSATWKSVNGAKKTGRHFPIEDILEQMRSE